MKKAFGQTVRDLKREVNKKVLKVPSIEQKVLDATSNEPWGPHGSHLADIAQASRNYHEYQIIMAVIWKRINDTGKNWRHVYKALTVLEYLVTYGSERVIEDIREHAYQISTLSDFQYIDSSGRDQGSNVRKKSQSLVILVNDKERIQEVRQKAAANRDKYRNTSMGNMYRPGSDRYDDDRHEGHYGSRDEGRNGYGREKEWGYRDDDKYGRYGDPCGRDWDRYGRDYEDRYSRDGYRDDDSKGRSRSVEEYQYGSRSRSSDKDRDQAYEDDGQYSRGNNARAEDYSQDGSSGHRHDRKFSEQNLDAPPSYEEAISEARSPVQSERDGETSMLSAPRSFSLPVGANSNQAADVPATMAAPAPPSASSPSTSHGPTVGSLPSQAPSPHPASNMEVGGFDEFDPRGSFKAVPTSAPAASDGSEMDPFGSLSDSFSLNALAIVPVGLATSDADALTNSSSGPSVVKISSASTAHNLAFDDPFGDGQFQAIPSTDSLPVQAQNVALNSSYPTSANQSSELPLTLGQEFGNTLPGTTHAAPRSSSLPTSSTNQQFLHQELSSPTQETDILADILPPTGASPSSMSQPSFPAAMGQPSVTGFSAQVGQQPLPGSVFPSHIGQSVSQTGFQSQTAQPVSLAGFPSQPGQAGPLVSFPVQVNQSGVQNSYSAQTGQYLVGVPGQVGQPALQPGFIPQSSQPLSATSVRSQLNMSETGFPASGSQSASTNNFYGNFQPQSQYAAPVAPQMASQIHTRTAGQNNSTNLLPQSGYAGLISSQMALQIPQLQPTTTPTSQSGVSCSPGPLSTATQQANDKFETKSAIWADTLNRGLVNLNISGPKTNPLADIGVDFDAINRKEKRMEKPTTAPITSNITMGKAMGSGSGIGRAGASALWSPPNPMMGSGMGGPGAGIGMGGYGGHPMGSMGMNMGMVMNINRDAGMNMGMNQGVKMQQHTGSTMPGGYNPMMGAGGYGRQPYGGY